MKLFWYKPITYSKERITAAIEAGADCVYVPGENIKEVRSLAKVAVISSAKEADLVIGGDVMEILVECKEREDDIEKLHGRIPVIVKNGDWTIIPLENLISKTRNIIQTVYNADQAKIALEALERGADGVILESDDVSEIKKTGVMVRFIGANEKLAMREAEIVSVETIGMGSRVCVDTASNLNAGEGLLCGDSGKAFFLVYNENVENPYCDPRPFRVNAGAVHAYVRIPEGRTKYLGELKTGDKVLMCNYRGDTRIVAVGRAKIEERPMLVVKGKVKSIEGEFTLVMQNAETIRLTKPDGLWVSAPQLKSGDTVLSYIDEEAVGRHFGRKVKEIIKEQ